jgi:spoIIIJ-associated protein
MEWVETTGRSIDEAVEKAVDLLGVDGSDAEVVVLSEPVTGWFGRLKVQARVRARVRPIRPRAKVITRERRGRGGEGRDDSGGAQRRSRNSRRSPGTDAAGQDSAGQDRSLGDAGGPKPEGPRSRGNGQKSDRASAGGTNVVPVTPAVPVESARSDVVKQRNLGHDVVDDEQESYDMDPEMMQAEAGRAAAFLEGLAAAFGTRGTAVADVGEEDINVALTGDDLGLMIGPRGATLQAVQDLTRVAAQRGGRASARLHVDVAGYRRKRSEALGRFTQQIAAEVITGGQARSLEPMSAPDRKVVHDAVQLIDGVESISDGEDPRRFVIIRPVG